MATKPYTFNIDDQLMQQFAEIARARGSSTQELLPDVIRDFVRAESDSDYNEWFRQQVQIGINQIETDQCTSGDEVEAEFAALREESNRRHP